MKTYLGIAFIMITLSSYAATGYAKDGALFILVIIALLAVPLAIEFLVKLISHKVKELCKH